MNKDLSLRIVLLFSSTTFMSTLAMIMPVMGSIAKDFPNAGTMLNMLISLPSLLMIPAILITGKLSQYVSKKTLLVIGTALFFIGGFGGVLYDNITYMLIMRGIMGIGCGITYPLPPAMIAQIYEGKEIPKMMGWASATGCFLASILTVVSGYLAIYNWRYSFYLYGIFALLVILQVIVLPKSPPEKLDPSIASSQEKRHLNLPVFIICFAALIYMTLQMVNSLKIAIFLQETNLGNSAFVGISQGIMTLLSFVAGVIFLQVFNIFKRNTVLLSLVIMAISFLLLSFANNTLPLIIYSIMMGFAMGIMMPFYMTRITSIAPKGTQTMALSLLTGSLCLGQFFSAYYVQAVDFFTNGNTRMLFLVVAICFVIYAIIELIGIIANTRQKKKNQKYSS